MDTEDGADFVGDTTDGDGRSLSRVEPGGSPVPVSALPQIDKMERRYEHSRSSRAVSIPRLTAGCMPRRLTRARWRMVRALPPRRPSQLFPH